MRILSLHFKNLNSLAGEWKIDFTDPEYVSSGIFAITGSTGAGKSTILDAICLALYGHTPRLGKISSNGGEIMTRQTGEYFSEVEFVSDKGRFRSVWSQRRADKKPGGKLQSPKHEIVDVKTGLPIETKQAAVQQKVIEITGLDYQQFTRSILLAQGEFATFLDAKADERAPILEKITGTEIYGQISIKVHERFGREKAMLDDLSTKADTIEMMTPEQAEAFQKEEREHEKKILEISAHCKGLEEATAWLNIITTLEQEISVLLQRQQVLVTWKVAARKDLDALSIARKARDLEGIYYGLFALRELQDKETAEMQNHEVDLDRFYAEFTNSLDAFRSARERRTAVLDEKQREDEVIKRVRELDTRIREIGANRDEREAEKRQSEQECGKYNQAIRSAEYQVTEIRQNLSKATAYLEAHPHDQKLIESFSGIESAVQQIFNTEKTAEKKKIELRDVENLLAETEQVVILRKKELDDVAKKEQYAIAEVSRIKKEFAEITGSQDISALRLLADWENDRRNRIQSFLDLFNRIEEDITEREKHTRTIDTARVERAKEEQRRTSLQKDVERAVRLVKSSEKNLMYLAQIKSYEDARKTLPEGTPCPLCGSADHPWCTGIVPVMDDAQKEHDEYKKEEEGLQKNVRMIEARLAGIDAEIRSGESTRKGLELKIGKATSELEGGCRDLGLSIGSLSKTTIAGALNESATRLGKIRETLTCAEEKERAIQHGETLVSREKDALAAIRMDYEKLLVYRDSQNRDRERLIKEIAATDVEHKRQETALLESIQEYDIIVFDFAPLTEQILNELTERRNNYVENLENRQDQQSLLQQYEAELEKNRSLLFSVEKTLADVLEKLSRINNDFKKYSAERRELYNEKDPAAEEIRVTRQIEAMEAVLSEATEAKNLADRRKSTCEEQIWSLAAKIVERIRVLVEKERDFSHSLTRAGFIGEDQFLLARMPPDQLTLLEKIEADLVREETEIAAGLTERTGKLAIEQERSLTREKREDLTNAIERDKAQMNALRLDLGRIQLQLEQFTEQVEKRLVLTEAISKQTKEFTKWQKLHDLIGSADGKRFRIFAQGLTFETLIVQANRHLRTMSDRYLLIRNKEFPLDLNIMDNYQAGEVRTTKNLSGGERFLISLALALGLSGMASNNIRIDSLFLDEGFGTLDEETLETALETLSSLQREGKIIGIISHVSALKERIPVQIQVETIGGGRSRLKGPGCSSPR